MKVDMIRRLAKTLLLIAAVSGCVGDSNETFSFAGKCPPSAEVIPAPWTFSTVPDQKDYFYGGLPHFSAPLKAFSVDVSSPASPDHLTIFVAIRRCGNRADKHYASTPCGTFEELSAGRNADEVRGVDRAVTVNDVRVENFPYFSGLIGEYVGQCTGVKVEQLTRDGRSTCRVWLPDDEGDRGLYIVMSGQAFPHMAKLIQQAKVFLAPQFKGCSLGLGERND